jgi:hypothetical protein
LLGALDAALGAIETNMAAAWSETVATLSPSTAGTDHGTATVGVLLGGALIPLMHIRCDEFAFIWCRRLQRYAGATVLYFLSTDPLAELSGGYGRVVATLCVATMRARAAFKCGHDPVRKIA